MKKAIIGTKIGMTQIFSKEGLIIPVTVVSAGPCVILQKKTVERDGYEALKVAFSEISENRANKPKMGEFKKANATPRKYLKELKIDGNGHEVGGQILCDIFQEGDRVDVSGTTRGRGFTGAIQRWNTHRLKMSHGSGPTHRSVGSMGANSSPSRVFKGKKMAGQYGAEKRTQQNLTIVKVDTKRNVLLIRGCIPGPKGGLIMVKETVKSK